MADKPVFEGEFGYHDKGTHPGRFYAPIKRCVRCGRSSKDTQLNVEGQIHHGNEIECLDRKDCGRAVKKGKKNGD